MPGKRHSDIWTDRVVEVLQVIVRVVRESNGLTIHVIVKYDLLTNSWDEIYDTKRT